MKIAVVGGGPGGLYFALLTKKAQPDWQIDIYEQNRADDTFGFGVVFSDETLEEFLSNDPPSYAAIKGAFAYWDDIIIRTQGQEIRCAGNGFAGCSRLALLKILQQRCEAVGVCLHYQSAVDDLTRFADCDVIVAADGINSRIREQYAEHFKPSVELKANKFAWLGSTRPLDAFTYFFKETPFGLICAHTYQYEPGQSTWVMEMSPKAWVGFGFDRLGEMERYASLRYFEELQARTDHEPVALAQLPARLLRKLVAQEHRAGGRCESERAFLDRVGDEACDGMRDCVVECAGRAWRAVGRRSLSRV
jgi:anthraniloyl-CoA monooxygenase